MYIGVFMGKVKRKRVDWFSVLVFLNNPDMNDYFHELTLRFYDRKRCAPHLSYNRIAYYTLKHYYSTTTVDELCQKLGEIYELC